MPFLITGGLGAAGDGTQSALATVSGLGDPGSSSYAPCTTNFTLMSAGCPGGTYVYLTFFSTPTISGPAASPSGYTITPLGAGEPITISAVEVLNPIQIRLTTSEHTNGEEYQIEIPSVGIIASNGAAFLGPFTTTYTAVSTPPTIISAYAINGRTLEVVFSEPVHPEDATDASNYSIAPTLSVSAAERITDSVYRLTTDRQTTGVVYTVTATNIRDLASNPV